MSLFRFKFAGMNIRWNPDSLPPEKSPCAINVRHIGGTSIQTRPGYNGFFGTASNTILDIHSYATLGTDGQPRFLAYASNGAVWLDGSPSGKKVTTMANNAGLGATFSPFRPANSPQTWMYLATQGDYQKISAPDANNNVSAFNVGIAEPQNECEAAPQAAAYTFLDFVAANWTATGNLTSLTDGNRSNDTGLGAILADPVVATRFSVQVGNNVSYQIGEKLQFFNGANNLGFAVIQNIIPPIASANAVTIAAIRYDSGNTGLCTIVPTQMPLPANGQAGYPQRGGLIRLGGNETVFIRSAVQGQDGSIALRVSTNNTHAANETVNGLPVVIVDNGTNLTTANDALAVLVTGNLSTGVGSFTHNFTPSTNPFVNVLGSSTSIPQQDDYIHISILVSDLNQIAQIKIIFNVDATDTTFTNNVLYFAIQPSALVPVATGLNTQAVDSFTNAQAIDAINAEIAAVQQQIYNAIYLTPTGQIDQGLLQQLYQQLDSLNAQLAALQSQPPGSPASGTFGQSASGSNQWSEVFFPISGMSRIGNDQTRTLANCTGVQVWFSTVSVTGVWQPSTNYALGNEIIDPAGHVQRVTTAGTSGTSIPSFSDTGGTIIDNTVHWTDQGLVATVATVNISSFWIGGGSQPDTGVAGAPYQYLAVPRNSLTGATGNPSNFMRYGVQPRRQAVSVVPPSVSYDTQIDLVDIYRYGGTVTSYRYMGTVSAGNNFVDNYFDDTAVAGTAVALDNFQPWPSIDLPLKITANNTFTITRYGTELDVVAPGQWPANIARWLPGTIIQLDGAQAYTLRSRPVSISANEYLFHIEESANAGNANTFLISEPVLGRQILPYVWGPDVTGTFFAVGDQLRPGVVAFSKPNNPDSAPDTYNLELTPPSEPLLGGELIDGLSYVCSTKRWWALYPSFNSTTQYTAVERPMGKGLVAPYAHCTDGKAIYFWTDEGIDVTSGGGANSLTDADLYPLFPHEGINGLNVVRNGQTIYAPDYNRSGTFRLSVIQGYLYADYQMNTGNPRTLVMDLATGGWVSDVYGANITCRCGIDQQLGPVLTAAGGNNYVTMVLGDANGNCYRAQNNFDDNLTPISCTFATFEWDGGQERSNGVWYDYYLDGEFPAANGLNATPQFLSANAPGTTTTVIAQNTNRTLVQTSMGNGVILRFAGMLYQWTDNFSGNNLQFNPTVLKQWGAFVAPEGVTAWRTPFINHGMVGYQHVGHIEAAYASTNSVTLQITAFDGTSPNNVVLPSTGGVYQKIFLNPTVNKGMLYQYAANSTAPFQFLNGNMVVYVGPWGRQGPYTQFHLPISNA